MKEHLLSSFSQIPRQALRLFSINSPERDNVLGREDRPLRFLETAPGTLELVEMIWKGLQGDRSQ